MSKKRTTVRFDEDQKQRVIAIAAQRGRFTSFSAIIWEALELWARYQETRKEVEFNLKRWNEVGDIGHAENLAWAMEHIFDISTRDKAQSEEKEKK